MWFSIGIVIILCFIVCYKSKSVIVTNPIIMEISLKNEIRRFFRLHLAPESLSSGKLAGCYAIGGEGHVMK